MFHHYREGGVGGSLVSNVSHTGVCEMVVKLFGVALPPSPPPIYNVEGVLPLDLHINYIEIVNFQFSSLKA